MSTLSSRRIVGLLAEESRRRVVASLMLHGDATTAEIADSVDLAVREVVDALDRLDGLVIRSGEQWSIRSELFQAAARAEADVAPPSAFGDEPAEIAKVLDTAFVDGHLRQLPTKRAKRLVVLDHLAQRFEIGQRYDEAAVNDTLREVHDDVAMLRRWLVDEQFLDRQGGVYWRCGGSV